MSVNKQVKANKQQDKEKKQTQQKWNECNEWPIEYLSYEYYWIHRQIPSIHDQFDLNSADMHQLVNTIY